MKDGDEDRDRGGDADSTASEQSATFRLCPPAEEVYGSPPEARLVREFKRPTVDALLELSDDQLSRLPGRVRRAVAALNLGDVAEADQRMDNALAPIRQGPGGHVRRRSALRNAALAIFVGALVSWLLWYGLGALLP